MSARRGPPSRRVARSVARAAQDVPLRPLACYDPSDLVAVGAEGTRTAADLTRDARAIARELRARAAAAPPERAARVVVAVEDRYRLAAAALGAWEAGLVVLLPPSTCALQVEGLAAGALALLHDGGAPAAAPDGVSLLDVREVQGEVGDDAPLAPLAPEQVLAVIHTSGSTGDPLPVPKTAGQLLGEARALVSAFGLERHRVAASAPGHHIYGLLFGVLVPLEAGGALLRRPPLHVEPLAAALREHEVDILVSVPAHLRALEALERGALRGLRGAFSSGAPLPAATARALYVRLGLEVTEVLGSTETGGIAWRGGLGDGTWRPLPGVRVEVASDGALLVDSPWLAPGTPRPLVTQDAAEPGPQGAFRHLGRRDGVVKVGGVRVSLAEVERLLLAIDGVRDAATIALEHATRGHEVGVAVALQPGAALDAAAIRAALAQRLDPVVIPRRVHILDALPREPTGKLPRARLLAALGLEPDTGASS